MLTVITKPVEIKNLGAIAAQSENPIIFENIVEKPGFRVVDILVKHRNLQARALGVSSLVRTAGGSATAADWPPAREWARPFLRLTPDRRSALAVGARWDGCF